jgi:thiol-disulfide isomerase/thioredoxin
MRSIAGLVLLLSAIQAQTPEAEQAELRKVLAEAGSSQVDFARAVERHLEKYPETAQRADLERAMVRVATELRDNRRLLLYGERVLEREAENIELLERVSRILLFDENKEDNTRALEYARRLEKAIRAMPPVEPGSRGAAIKAQERQFGLGKALVYQARATGNLGHPADALKFAQSSYEVFPSAESAREAARWLHRLGRVDEAIRWQADAFTIPDRGASDEDRRKDRARLGEWYRQLSESEKGLGDRVLEAWDRTQTVVDNYRASLKQLDPNEGARDPMQFTLSGLEGDKLALSSLKGKVVVLDFWATWCGPCRAQQPLYEQVKEKYRENPDVVLLNVNTDENRAVVKPFLQGNGWKKTIYFEDGLSALLRVGSIPTTVVINRRGEVVSRMNGYIPERFVDMLSERIDEALQAR